MKTPVLFLIFNRPETTSKVFEEIKKYKPTQLFIAADGPRKNKPEENLLCEQTRDIVRNINWECEIKTLFRDQNLGCKIACTTAITWFFNNVEKGIILEDDCLPNSSFFSFCEDLLDRYEHDEKVGMITGDNFIDPQVLKLIDPNKNAYHFVKPVYLWGWASWRRAWNKYDVTMKAWPQLKKEKYINKNFKNHNVALFWSHILQYTYSGHDTWDPQWLLACLQNKMLCILPPRNLVVNIGFEGTHTNKTSPRKKIHTMQTETISIDTLNHPESATLNIDIENLQLKYTGVSAFSYRIHIINILELLKLKTAAKRIYRKYNLKF